MAFTSVDGDPITMGLPNFFDDPLRSPDGPEPSQSWSSRTNPFFMINNPFSHTFSLQNQSVDQDMTFSSPLSESNHLVGFGAGLARQPSGMFPSFSTGPAVDQSPALTSITHTTTGFSGQDTPLLHHAPTLLPALSIAPDADRMSAIAEDPMSAGASTPFDILPLSSTPKPVLQKKNTRVEIPPERTLQNIDDLIRGASSEEQIKELKKQKRLLRNRKAALDSRIRKRLYTHNLERDKDGLKDEVQTLQERLHQESMELGQKLEAVCRERDQYLQQLRTLKMEREEEIGRHIRETANLRKRIQFLSAHGPQAGSKAQSQPQQGIPTISEPSSAFNFFEPPSMAMTDYDSLMNFDSPLGFGAQLGLDQAWPDFQPLPEMTPVPASPMPSARSKSKCKDGDAPAGNQQASGLLWLLLLCGAFVATKSSGSSAPTIPKMPEEVRAASASVLDSIFQDAGMGLSSSAVSKVGVAGANPSDVARFVSSVNDALALKTSAPSAADSTSLTTIKAETVNMFTGTSKLLEPSIGQEGEQLFSMTADQYSSIHSAANSRPGSLRGRANKRRSLTDALNNMRANRRDASTDTAAGGLLWNSIPAHVIREFRRMVDEDTTNGPRAVQSPSMT